MTADERALLPPPPRCMTCNALQQVGQPGAVRSTCLLGEPMHNECGWFEARRPTTQELSALNGANPL